MTADSSPPVSGSKKPSRSKIFAVVSTIAVAVVIVIGIVMANLPPSGAYDSQAEAYAPMESIVVDTIEALPDFPGFEARSWRELPCSRNGVDDENYTNIEMSYSFSEEDSKTELVREEYVRVLREHWIGLGYEIKYEETSETPDGRVDRDISVRLDNGVTVWYSAWGRVSLIVQSGCLPASDKSEIEYVPPVGGVEPGGEGDHVGRYFPDGIPAEGQSVDAIAPFESPDSYIDLF